MSLDDWTNYIRKTYRNRSWARKLLVVDPMPFSTKADYQLNLSNNKIVQFNISKNKPELSEIVNCIVHIETYKKEFEAIGNVNNPEEKEVILQKLFYDVVKYENYMLYSMFGYLHDHIATHQLNFNNIKELFEQLYSANNYRRFWNKNLIGAFIFNNKDLLKILSKANKLKELEILEPSTAREISSEYSTDYFTYNGIYVLSSEHILPNNIYRICFSDYCGIFPIKKDFEAVEVSDSNLVIETEIGCSLLALDFIDHFEINID